MQRITTIDTTSQHDPARRLYGPSHRFGVRTFLGRGHGDHLKPHESPGEEDGTSSGCVAKSLVVW